MLAGFEKSSEGQIFFQGTDVTDLPPNERKINTVFQKYALFPHLNIYDNISFGLKEKKVPKDEIEARTLNQIENRAKVGIDFQPDSIHNMPSDMMVNHLTGILDDKFRLRLVDGSVPMKWHKASCMHSILSP